MLDHPSLWSAAFIHLASLAYVIAFLTTNQYSLRLLVVVGTLLELLYFYFIADAPLWDAIVWSIIFLAANLFTLSRLLRDRMGIDLDDDELRLHSALPDIQPGDFRQIAKLSRRCTAPRRTDLTREGGPLDGLYFLLDGIVELDRDGAARDWRTVLLSGKSPIFCPGPPPQR